MSTTVIDRPLSYEEERGKPMPSLNHSLAQMKLGIELSKLGRFQVLSELSLELGGKRLTPDLSIYPMRQVDWQNDVVRETTPPLTTVEIFSPQQDSLEVMAKVEHYLANGVKTCWVVAPPLRTITIYVPGQRPKTFSEGLAIDPVTGLQADVGEVFC